MQSSSIWMEFISLWPFLKVVSLGLYTTKPVVVSPFKACCELHCSNGGKCDFAWIMVILFGLCRMHKTMSYGVSSEGILGLFSSFRKVLAHTDMTVTAPYSVAGAQMWQKFNTCSQYLPNGVKWLNWNSQYVSNLWFLCFWDHTITCFHFNLFSSSLGVISSSKATFNILKGPITFFSSSAKSAADTLVFQVCHFPGMPKSQMEQHTVVLNKILLGSCMYYSLIPSWSNSTD